jgi:hypothetical protein
MKILPVVSNIFNLNSLNTNSVVTSPYGNFPKTQDSFELSFQGNKYLDTAKQTSGIHCPVCGTPMLSEEDYQQILQEAREVRNKQDFCELLQKYEKFIPKEMRAILDDRGGDNFYDYIAYLKSKAYVKNNLNIANSNKYLLNFVETTQDEKALEDLKNAIAMVLPDDSSFKYKQKIFPALKQLNLPKDVYWKILTETVLKMNDASEYLDVFYRCSFADGSVSDLSQNIVSRLFKHSLIHSSPMTKICDLDNPNNEILLCGKCNWSASNASFFNSNELKRPDFRDNILKYLEDITFIVGQNSAESSYEYTKHLCSFIGKISKNKISFNSWNLRHLLALDRTLVRHETFAPIAQTKTDIPCAGCGSTMLPHEIKKDIEKELKGTDSIAGYMRILKKYDKYVGSYGRYTADMMLEIAQKYPNLEKEEFFQCLKKRVDRKTDSDIQKIISGFGKARNYILSHNTVEEVEKYDLISKRVHEYIQSGELRKDFNYKRFAQEALNGIDINEDTPALVYKFLHRIKMACYKNSLIQCNEYDKEYDKDKIQTILFKLFGSNLATADHFVAASQGGEGSIDNMIGLCKGCNKIAKGKKKIYSWVVQNKEIENNFLAQVNTVNQMSKNGEIKGYENWAKNIAEKMYELSYGNYDIRDKIE